MPLSPLCLLNLSQNSFRVPSMFCVHAFMVEDQVLQEQPARSRQWRGPKCCYPDGPRLLLSKSKGVDEPDQENMLIVDQRVVCSPFLEDILIGEVIAVFELSTEVGLDAILVCQGQCLQRLRHRGGSKTLRIVQVFKARREGNFAV